MSCPVPIARFYFHRHTIPRLYGRPVLDKVTPGHDSAQYRRPGHATPPRTTTPGGHDDDGAGRPERPSSTGAPATVEHGVPDGRRRAGRPGGLQMSVAGVA